LASFDFDQAEGLRRMLAGPKPRILTFLSATTMDEKRAMLLNLSASLARTCGDVLLFDACVSGAGVASRMALSNGATLLEVARQERALNDAIHVTPQGFNVARLTSGPVRSLVRDTDQSRRLAASFGVLAARSGMVLVDGELDSDGALPIDAMANGEVVVQVANSAASIKTAYGLIKRLHGQLGRRPFGVLVTGASEAEAKVVYDNMAHAASRYLGLQLTSVGSVPADESVNRAARLGRSVVDAFPLAGASVAFRQLAGRFSLAGG
jgi:flagellar biosynthesis protein FlhG